MGDSKMDSDAPTTPARNAQDVPEVEMADAASLSPDHDQDRESAPPSGTHRQRQHAPGWSLEDREYESESASDYEGESSCSEAPSGDDQDQQDDGDQIAEIREWLKAHCKDSLFACGGMIPIMADTCDTDGPKEETSIDEKTPSSPTSVISRASSTVLSTTPVPPVTLRWDPRDAMAPAAHCKLNFPIKEPNAENLDRLIADMEPATFGRGGEHVYDGSYRKASKLDPSSFSTNFCPYASGIIDAMSQLLLPNQLSQKQRSIKAELYKLNVYTGPSGHFRSHVDTPRSQHQIGSLVVCLPATHEGGTLQVRQLEQTMSFDWAKGCNGPQIQWAAFYSDCEHEVFPVRSGHRITLTYNLCVTRGDGQLSNHPNALDIAQTPLYRHLETLIADGAFLPDGGYLGFYTTHAYPHTSSAICLTDTLKGIDMNLWDAFRRLGCGVCLRPILTSSPFRFMEPDSRHIGKTFKFEEYSWCVEEERDWKEVLKRWGVEDLSPDDLVWLNEPDPATRQTSFVYMTHGNEPSTNLAYSLCAIIIGVPKYADNGRMALETTFAPKISDENWEDHPPYPYDDRF